MKEIVNTCYLTDCSHGIDLAFIIDKSQNIAEEHFEEILEFLKEQVDESKGNTKVDEHSSMVNMLL